ncbi:MAG: ribonuclease P protein component 1 [Nitrososphaeria archaeon]|nr:ribonuclease P protein component 1 [Nitrososphaeria archaeon]
MITQNNIFYHELICLQTKVVDSRIKNLVGLSGKVVMETKNMLYIDDGTKVRAVPKKVSVFEFILPSGSSIKLSGVSIVGRPESRLSKMR